MSNIEDLRNAYRDVSIFQVPDSSGGWVNITDIEDLSPQQVLWLLQNSPASNQSGYKELPNNIPHKSTRKKSRGNGRKGAW